MGMRVRVIEESRSRRSQKLEHVYFDWIVRLVRDSRPKQRGAGLRVAREWNGRSGARAVRVSNSAVGKRGEEAASGEWKEGKGREGEERKGKERKGKEGKGRGAAVSARRGRSIASGYENVSHHT